MDFGAIAKRMQKATADNAPTILTAIGVTGLVTTAVLTGRASFKAAEILNEDNRRRDMEALNDPDVFVRETRETVELVWKYYVPAVGTGAVTIACIIAASRIHTRRAAALASAYTISQELFREYKGKVLEKLGENKEQAVRDEIAQDRIKKNPPSAVVMLGQGEVLCLDLHSGRYFNCEMHVLKRAVNDVNYQIIRSDYASLTDFWERIGLPKTAESDEIGWCADSKFDVQFGTVLSEDDRPCITVDFDTVPIRGYYALYH